METAKRVKEAQMDTLTVDSMKVRIHRQGAGRSLTYLHSAAAEVGSLPFFDALDAAGFALTVPELPGFGQSSETPSWRNIDDAVYDIRRTLDVAGVDRTVLVGSSVGGWLAAEFAVWFPDRVEALVLISALGLRVAGAPVYDLFGGPGSDPQVRAKLSNPHDFDMLSVLQPLIGDGQDALMLHMLRGLQGVARIGWDPYLHDPRLPGRLATLDVPTLVVWGADDGLVPPQHGRAYVDAIPNSRLELIATCGHGVVLEQASTVAATIAAFVHHLSASA